MEQHNPYYNSCATINNAIITVVEKYILSDLLDKKKKI